jgi:hypothetical protein
MNRNLPSFVVIAPHLPYAGAQAFANDFLPAYHQGTRVIPGKDPIPNVNRQAKTADLQELELGLAGQLNRAHLARNGNDSDLAARVRTFETAFRMQFEAPEAFDLSKETKETLDLYGLTRGDTESFAWQCLIARRLAERGVRFVELIDTGSNSAENWDAHSDMAAHAPLAKKIDKPIAGLLTDLKRRGMLADTLVVLTSHRHNWAVGLSLQITWKGLGLLHSDYDASMFSCQAILQRSKCFSLTRTFIHTSLSLSDKTKSFQML